VEDFQRMAQSEARMPCHVAGGRIGVNYAKAQEDGTRDFNLPQCAGRAIHWANQIKTQKIPGALLELPRNTVAVFEWPQEFTDHHKPWNDTMMALQDFHSGVLKFPRNKEKI
jgi:hypothetical protein